MGGLIFSGNCEVFRGMIERVLLSDKKPYRPIGM